MSMDDYDLSPSSSGDYGEGHALHRTFTGRAAYFNEHYADPVESIAGGYAPSVYSRHSRHHTRHSSSRRQASPVPSVDPSTSTAPSAAASSGRTLTGLEIGNWAGDPPDPEGQDERPNGRRAPPVERSGSRREGSGRGVDGLEVVKWAGDPPDGDRQDERPDWRRTPPRKRSGSYHSDDSCEEPGRGVDGVEVVRWAGDPPDGDEQDERPDGRRTPPSKRSGSHHSDGSGDWAGDPLDADWRDERPSGRRAPPSKKSGSCHSDGLAEGSGHTEGLTDDQSESSDFEEDEDEDEDQCEEHYRRLPPASPLPAEAGEPRIVPREGRRNVARRRNLEPVERKEARSVFSVQRRSSEEVAAGTRDELALVEPSTSRHSGYQHSFITIMEEHRFLMLYTFLKRSLDKKVIVYFSTTKSVQFYARLLDRLKFDVRAIHSGQSKERFIGEFMDFSGRDSGGILCVPDSRGGDLTIPPTCDWLVQFEPPADPSEYIFRVGRVAAEDGRSRCRAMLFMTPAEFGFLDYYRAARVKFYEYEIPKISKVQKELVRLVRSDARLREAGVNAYHAYLTAYASHDHTDVYDVHGLDRRRVAKCFGFDDPPSSRDDPEEETFQERMVKRERSRWSAIKAERKSWMRGEKSWRGADVHADKMRPPGA